MMDAPLKSELERQYARRAARARRELTLRHPGLAVCLPGDPDYPSVPGEQWREVLRVPASVSSGVPTDMLVAIPFAFPDEFPVVFLPRSATSAEPMPHVDKRRLLCTFDKTEAYPNADANAADIVEAVIARAAELWNQACLGNEELTRREFEDELQAYWEDGSSENALSLIRVDDNIRRVYVTYLKKGWRGYKRLFTETPQEAVRWLASTGATGRTVPSLYLPLKSLGVPPFPRSNGELVRHLVSSDPTSVPELMWFLRTATRPATVLFSAPAAIGRVVGAWEHAPVLRERMTRTGRIREPAPVAGFRPGHCPPEIEMTQANADGMLTRFAVDRIDQERLLQRTSGEAPTKAGSIAFVGCGSVGGFLADNLVRLGVVRKARFIDAERLMPENVFRHVCGADWIGIAKSDALRSKLTRHYPFLEADSLAADVLDVMRRTPGLLGDSDLTVVSLGNQPVERRINKIARTQVGRLGAPICFAWVEPRLAAGHVVYLGDPGGTGCFECLFDDRSRFIHQVVDTAELSSLRESGCQSSYVPYGGADLAEFCAAAARFIRRQVVAPQQGNIIFTWVSEDIRRETSSHVSSDTETSGEVAILIRRIVPRPGCRTCGV